MDGPMRADMGIPQIEEVTQRVAAKEEAKVAAAAPKQ